MKMMHVVLRLPDGRQVYVPPGSVIGRLVTSAVPINDPRISEAHVLVTHRGDSMWMISLQPQPIKVLGERSHRSVKLETGQRLSLAEGYVMEVMAVVTPDHLPQAQYRKAGESVWHLLGNLDGHEHYSVMPGPLWAAGPQAGALFRLACGVDSWVLFSPEGDTIPIEDLDIWSAGEWEFRFLWRPVEQAGIAKTMAKGHLVLDYSIESDENVVRIIPLEGSLQQEPLTFVGQHRLLLLALLREPTPRRWQVLGAEVWDDWGKLDRTARERRWNPAIHRLRKRLAEHALDPDLIYRDEECPGRYGIRPGSEIRKGI